MGTKNIIWGPKVTPLARPLLAIVSLCSPSRSETHNVTNLLEATQVQQWGLLHFQFKIRSFFFYIRTDVFFCYSPSSLRLFQASRAESLRLSTRKSIAGIHIVWITIYQANFFYQDLSFSAILTWLLSNWWGELLAIHHFHAMSQRTNNGVNEKTKYN